MSTMLHIELTTLRCSECGIIFGIEEFHRKNIQERRATFHCPNGHSQWYPGRTKEQELKELLDAKAAELTKTKSEALSLKMKCESVERELLRHRKRAASGVCPCCHRTISQMARHMKTRHPDFKP